MSRIDVGCYYFPNYHPNDARNAALHGPGWSEWELVKHSVPRWEGHHQPLVPLWGYTDESRPEVMTQKIDAALKAHIDYFIFDYYHYGDGTFLSDCLDAGFLPAVAGKPFKFALMWANHDWLDIHPCNRRSRELLYPGIVTPEEFRSITDFIIEKYLKHPNYYCIDGKPYFSIYHLQRLMDGFGSVAATRAALDDLHVRAEKAGLPGLNLNAVVWGSPVLPGENSSSEPEKIVGELGFDSMSSYVWVHHANLPNQNEYPFEELEKRYLAAWDRIEAGSPLPYYPNATVGWDPSPRTVPSEIWSPEAGYPYTAAISGNTPEAFRRALANIKARMLERGTRTMSINCWNEWTEGSMLEPEERYGTGYLDAVAEVFGK